ncbi:hypothetical protein HNP92_000907 [Methanococcus maripaludis]|uniref:Uncharacterized protein n=1 Tax=Methanococcus maripaludis TaxID=39152 RepID=A0A7J9S4B1_METMI|nr:hypothetical protein [Methanococcus maripaludis]MBB6401602.1 hypothetical protein [Methanococcus maripaludis]
MVLENNSITLINNSSEIVSNVSTVFSNNSSEIVSNVSTALINNTPPLDSAWIFSIVVLVISIHQILSKSQRRNIFYILGYFEYMLIFSTLLLIYVTIAHYTISYDLCNSLLSLVITDIENPLMTFSYLYGLIILAYFLLNFKNNRLSQINRFIDKLYDRFTKKDYLIILTDLEIYFEELYEHYLMIEKDFEFNGRFECFLNIISDEEEFISEMAKKYPMLLYKLLNSSIDFDKDVLWANYWKYLVSTKGSDLYKELKNLNSEDYFDLSTENILELEYDDDLIIKSIFNIDIDINSSIISTIGHFIKKEEQMAYTNGGSDIELLDSPIYIALLIYDLKLRHALKNNSYTNIKIFNPIMDIISKIVTSMEIYWRLFGYYALMEQYLELIFKLYYRWTTFSKKDVDFGLELVLVISMSFHSIMTARLNPQTKDKIYNIMKKILKYIDEEMEEEVKKKYFEKLFEGVNLRSENPISGRYDNLELIDEIYSKIYSENLRNVI